LSQFTARHNPPAPGIDHLITVSHAALPSVCTRYLARRSWRTMNTSSARHWNLTYRSSCRMVEADLEASESRQAAGRRSSYTLGAWQSQLKANAEGIVTSCYCIYLKLRDINFHLCARLRCSAKHRKPIHSVNSNDYEMSMKAALKATPPGKKVAAAWTGVASR
jgi:hypothetical protein